MALCNYQINILEKYLQAMEDTENPNEAISLILLDMRISREALTTKLLRILYDLTKDSY